MNYEEEDELHTKKESKAARKIISKKDRSQSKKTDLKKRERILLEETHKRLAKKDLIRGRVLGISADEIAVQHETEIFLCSLRGQLKNEWFPF